MKYWENSELNEYELKLKNKNIIKGERNGKRIVRKRKNF